MKSHIKKLIIAITNNNILWPIIRPFAIFGFFAVNNRKKPAQIVSHVNDTIQAIFPTNQVLHGPFQGMKYPSFAAVGSALYPKLLGCYEKELSEAITDLLQNNYAEIIDIGCAEGYYAIGLGLRLPNTQIYAYDTDETARGLCRQMAKLNGIDERVSIKQTCTPEILESFPFNGRALIICDCEGFENDLFTKANIQNLLNCDLIIETHDFLNLRISDNLVKLFSATHHIHIVKSIDDIEKAKTYNYPETANLPVEEKYMLYRECRPAIMEWLICNPKQAAAK
ncbi:50S ribosomal protein L11 methyltransferase [Mucilaginibacter boryungensis]|uniref:Methyltransferase n=1 Tax=Mucilaginibacter boryungensis TaxID=768480 RepID=A0ABR9XF46_9SPHI|nr:50S ribosomal protein L11 methyltransferase [Mucilaginibacter boryungensis]MBE9666008.1 methyltransferase [Mucilaginibacter boryungensis]